MSVYRVAPIFIALISLAGCASTDVKTSMDSASKFVWDLMGWHDTEVKDPGKYEAIRFEKAINRAFAQELGDKEFRFQARYKGTVPEPGKYKVVDGYINIKLCDVQKTEVCSDLCVVKADKSDMVFDIRHDQVVEAYGFILQTSGIRTGGGVDLGWSQMGTSSPYNFVRVIKLVPVGKTM